MGVMNIRFISAAVALSLASLNCFADATQSLDNIQPKAMKGGTENVTAARMSRDSDHSMQSSHKMSDDFLTNYENLKGKVLTPSAAATVDGYGVSLSADFIYWYARQEGLAFASTGEINETTLPVSNNTISEGQRFYPDFKVKPGFKVALGYQMDYDGWDLNLNYTWLHSKAGKTMNKRSDTQASTLWEVRSEIEVGSETAINNLANISAALVSAKADWKLHFNVMNLELGRNFFVSPKLTLRPHFGLKGSWQSQRYNIDYTGLGTIDILGLINIGSAHELYKIRSKENYWGLGLRFGLDTSWLFSKNWSLVGNIALSPMWGQFTERRTDRMDLSDSSVDFDSLDGLDLDQATVGDIADLAPLVTNFEVLKTRMRSHSINPVLEMMMGFRYDVWFSDNNMRFRFEAGWEEQHWLSHNAFSFSSSDDMFGSLIFQGLTIKARYDF
ncbi:MAG: hypothetical protein S4CHLAM37_11940 [Chlamydiia bacterium]|nr:hypothetical protein [Chlamydiia bacterium]